MEINKINKDKENCDKEKICFIFLFLKFKKIINFYNFL